MKTGKIILWSSVILAVVLLAFYSFGFRITSTSPATNGDYNNIPEECRPAAGQDITAWKEHLGHHAETRDCLKYFN